MEGSGEVRKRQRGEASADQKQDRRDGSNDSVSPTSSPREDKRGNEGNQIEPGSYWLTRITFIRALGFIYCM